jgi:hypothetical protein
MYLFTRATKIVILARALLASAANVLALNVVDRGFEP